jgi:hypothetical protein
MGYAGFCVNVASRIVYIGGLQHPACFMHGFIKGAD